MHSFSALQTLLFGVLAIYTGIDAPAVAQTSVAPRYALLVGVDDYALKPDGTPSMTPLKGPRNDVALMKKLLIDRFGYQDNGAQIVTLVGPEATHSGIRGAFADLMDRAASAPHAIVLFYFSGHGSQIDDTNGDEGDGVDETLVAYDSRLSDKNDILDDELAAWQAELMRRAPTTKITYILDSCHSGTGIKGLSASANRQARYAAPARPLRTDGGPARYSDLINAVLPEGRDYVLLAGSTANQRSYEDVINTASSPVVHGFFTWYLAQTLRQNPLTSYDALIRRISGPIQSAAGDQTPQAEGSIEGYVLNGTGESEDPSLPIVRLGPSNTLELAAGATLGLRQGSLLAIYRPGTKRLVGDSGKIAEARITAIGNATSVATLIGSPTELLTPDARVALVTPYFGTGALRAHVIDLPGQTTTLADQTMLAAVAQQLRSHRFVAVTNPGDEWDVAVNRGCVNQGRLYILGEAEPADCTVVYYLRPRASSIALMGFSTPSDANAAPKIAESIELYARQNNVRAIENQLSTINGQVKLVLIRVNIVTGPDGRPAFEPQLPSPTRGVTPIKVGESFLLRVENDSDYPLHVAVFNLASGGNTSLVGAATNGDLVAPHNRMMIIGKPWTIGPPLGEEGFKVIATTSSNVNFRILDGQRVAARGPQVSPLEWLLATAVDAKVRDAAPSGVDLSEWTTTQLNLQIVP